MDFCFPQVCIYKKLFCFHFPGITQNQISQNQTSQNLLSGLAGLLAKNCRSLQNSFLY